MIADWFYQQYWKAMQPGFVTGCKDCEILRDVKLPHYEMAEFGGHLWIPCERHLGEAQGRRLADLRQYFFREKKRGKWRGFWIYTGWGQCLGRVASEHDAREICDHARRAMRFVGVLKDGTEFVPSFENVPLGNMVGYVEKDGKRRAVWARRGEWALRIRFAVYGIVKSARM